MLPDDVKARIETRSGDVNLAKRKRFMEGIKLLLKSGYTDKQVLQMDADCIDNKGRIDVDRFDDILAGKFDD